MQNIPKTYVSDILINTLVEMEHSHNEFKEQYEDRLKALEAKVTSLNNNIKNLLQVSHVSVKNNVEALETLFKKISQLREEQVYFSELMDIDDVAKGKGKKSLKADDKVLVQRGSGEWKKVFDTEKKALLDMVEKHKSQ